MDINWLENQKIYAHGVYNGSAAPWFQQARETASGRLETLEAPSSKLEEWKYTNIQKVLSKDFAYAPKYDLTVQEFELLVPEHYRTLSSNLVVLVNGRFSESLSSIATENGVEVKPLSKVLTDESFSDELSKFGKNHYHSSQALLALNEALVIDGLYVCVEKGAAQHAPLHIINVCAGCSKPSSAYPKIVVQAHASSEYEIIESFFSADNVQTMTCASAEFLVGNNAKLSYSRVQKEGNDAVHVSFITATLGRDSSLATRTFDCGGALTRNQIFPILAGENIYLDMKGLSILQDTQHVDNFTEIDHTLPHCDSVEIYKGIYGDKSSGAFSGTIIVREGAQKTNAIQSNRSVLLSEKASVNTKPQLKIWADDVKCTHGATIGQLDEEAMFYLRARGISEQEARSILTYAFASEVIEEIQPEGLQDIIETEVRNKLKEMTGTA